MLSLHSRAHLEALLIAFVLLDPDLLLAVDASRLSPAAVALVSFAADDNTAARASLGFAITDEYQSRLALRVDALTFEELRYYPMDTLLGLVNALPALAVRGRTARRVA